VEYAAVGYTVCHTCFMDIAQASVRVVRQQSTEMPALVSPALALMPPALVPPAVRVLRDFHHLGCCLPRCPFGDLQGFASLQPADQERVQLLMAAAVPAPAPEAPVPEQAPALDVPASSADGHMAE
jgi:hypothetical protein